MGEEVISRVFVIIDEKQLRFIKSSIYCSHPRRKQRFINEEDLTT